MNEDGYDNNRLGGVASDEARATHEPNPQAVSALRVGIANADPTDCGPDGGCEECDVCRYLNFLEWAGQVAGGVPSTIERKPDIEAYLLRTYPHLEGQL